MSFIVACCNSYIVSCYRCKWFDGVVCPSDILCLCVSPTPWWWFFVLDHVSDDTVPWCLFPEDINLATSWFHLYVLWLTRQFYDVGRESLLDVFCYLLFLWLGWFLTVFFIVNCGILAEWLWCKVRISKGYSNKFQGVGNQYKIFRTPYT